MTSFLDSDEILKLFCQGTGVVKAKINHFCWFVGKAKLKLQQSQMSTISLEYVPNFRAMGQIQLFVASSKSACHQNVLTYYIFIKGDTLDVNANANALNLTDTKFNQNKKGEQNNISHFAYYYVNLEECVDQNLFFPFLIV